MHRVPFLIAKSLRDITVHKALSKHIDPTVTEPTSTEKGGNKASVICKIQYCDGKCARKCLAIDRPVGEAPLIALITKNAPLTPGKAAHQTCLAQEPAGSDETEQGNDSVGPQQSLEETLRPVGSRILQYVSFASTNKDCRRLHTVKPNLSTPSLVMQTAKKALLKIQNVTSLVRKLLYESSRVFSSFSTGGT